MKYLVMETHLSHAVVLDEEGRLLKVANFRYEVGQRVNDIVLMESAGNTESQKPKAKILNIKVITSIAAAAACLVLAVGVLLNMHDAPYASVYMTINPELRIDVDRDNTVVEVEGVNKDGKDLVKGYDHQSKKLDPVMDELVDLAIEQGYLSSGGDITLKLDADDKEWEIATEKDLESHLTEYLGAKTESVHIHFDHDSDYDPENATDYNSSGDDYGDTDYGSDAPVSIVVPTAPDTSVPVTTVPPVTSTPGASDYNDTDYGVNNDGVTDYNTPDDDHDTDYGVNNDGVTDYNTPDDDHDTDYGVNNDGVTDYDTPDDDGNSDYTPTVTTTVPVVTTVPPVATDPPATSTPVGDSNYGDGNSNYGDDYDNGDSNYGNDDNNGDSGYDNDRDD